MGRSTIERQEPTGTYYTLPQNPTPLKPETLNPLKTLKDPCTSLLGIRIFPYRALTFFHRHQLNPSRSIKNPSTWRLLSGTKNNPNINFLGDTSSTNGLYEEEILGFISPPHLLGLFREGNLGYPYLIGLLQK